MKKGHMKIPSIQSLIKTYILVYSFWYRFSLSKCFLYYWGSWHGWFSPSIFRLSYGPAKWCSSGFSCLVSPPCGRSFMRSSSLCFSSQSVSPDCSRFKKLSARCRWKRISSGFSTFGESIHPMCHPRDPKRIRLQHHISKASILLRSVARSVHVSASYKKMEKIRALMSLVFTLLNIEQFFHIFINLLTALFAIPVCLLISSV